MVISKIYGEWANDSPSSLCRILGRGATTHRRLSWGYDLRYWAGYMDAPIQKAWNVHAHRRRQQ